MPNTSPGGFPPYHRDAHWEAKGSIKHPLTSCRDISVGKLQSHPLGTGELLYGTAPPGPLALLG